MVKGQFVGTFMRELRQSKGHSLFSLGRKTGLDPQTLRRCEVTGQITPRSARRISQVLGCKAEDLKPRDLRGKWNRNEG